jgi:signal transduction histidine kinase
VRIEVADNGIGIEPEQMARLFQQGFTTRKNGHGLGLHGAALAAKEMAGALTAHSEGRGKGATFVLELPLRPS